MHYLHLIRYKNLLLIAFMQLCFFYGFLKLQTNITLALNHWQYAILILATFLIAAGGNVINDIQDQETDAINKPNKCIVGTKITEENAFNIYIALTILGVSLGYWLSHIVLRPSFVIVFILSASLLYFYSTTFKQIAVLGNIIIAFLLALSILIIGVFAILPALSSENQPVLKTVFSVLFDFSVIAFIINFIREFVKDIEDFEGDFKQSIRTLPVIIGIGKSKKIALLFSLIPLLLILYYVYNYLFHLTWATLFIFLFIIGPLLFIILKLFSAKLKTDYALISSVFKLIIFFGILSSIAIAINMKYYVA